MVDADPVVSIILEHRKLSKLLSSLIGHLDQATKYVAGSMLLLMLLLHSTDWCSMPVHMMLVCMSRLQQV
jgi:hypothetical protein